MSNSYMPARVVVTGMGMLTPIGSNPPEILASLRSGRCAIGPIRSMDLGLHVAEVPGFDDADHAEEDRATRMARSAASMALGQAERAPGLDRSRLGVAVGMSGSGQFQTLRFALDRSFVVGPELVRCFDRNVPHFQAERLARAVGSRGPRACVCSASTGSGIAIGLAARWLRARKVDAVLAGGAEALTLLTLLGMKSLGIMAEGRNAPFGGPEGITFGEGAAYFVLEREDAAKARGAEILAELLGVASSNDGYDPIANDPSGHGLARAIRGALRDAGTSPAAVDWVRASGTGHREQDLAETLGIKEAFVEGRVPPVSSPESLLGHANGAAPAIGMGLAILTIRNGFIPATHHFQSARPGCDLDYVPNEPRAATVSTVVCNCVAFGGSNAALVVGEAKERPAPRARRRDGVVITGVGLVTPIGHDLAALAAALYRPDARRPGPAARIEAWRPQAELPGVDLRRVERLGQFATVAAARALAGAGLGRTAYDPERVGLMTGLGRGPAAASERFMEEVLRSPSSPSLGRLMLRMGRFSVASVVSHALRLLGPTATISEGAAAGLHTLCHAVEVLRDDDGVDAMVVVSADEISDMLIKIDIDAGRVSSEPGGMRPYRSDATGSVAGEGAVALVIERAAVARHRGARPLARIAGYGLCGGDGISSAGSGATSEALREAGLDADDLDLIVGCGRGRPAYDLAERDGLMAALGSRSRPCPYTAATATGVLESASGLMAVLAALIAAERSQAPPLAPEPDAISGPLVWATTAAPGRFDRILVAGGTDEGHAATVLLDGAAPRAE